MDDVRTDIYVVVVDDGGFIDGDSLVLETYTECASIDFALKKAAETELKLGFTCRVAKLQFIDQEEIDNAEG